MIRKLVLFLCPLILIAQKQTALDRYVAAPDSHYKYEIVKTVPGKGYTLYVVDLTSQQWRTEKEVDHPIWKHWLTIVKPDEVKSNIGFLYINGGDNNDKVPDKPDVGGLAMALATNSVAAEIHQIPNQPLVFADDGKPRVEDQMIAYTWDRFLKGGDDNWPARLPMTKAVVRAMDTITAVTKSVDRFVVAGGSKRGWTTWTTAAVDKRVVAIAPLVIDLLNVPKSFDHHYRAYGAWADAIGDYKAMGVMDWIGTKRYRELLDEVEPYSYRDRYTMPKYIISAAGDQFFLPDSSQFYWNGLKGEKYLRYVPNADHSLRGSDARESVLAYYESIVNNTPRPQMTWKFEKDGAIHVVTKTKPSEVKLWQATDEKARDFRVVTVGKAYTSSTLAEKSPGVFEANVVPPAKGWTAYFIELTYPTGKHAMKLTTAVRVVPDTLPFGPPPHPIAGTKQDKK